MFLNIKSDAFKSKIVRRFAAGEIKKYRVMKAIEFLKQYRVHEDDVIYNSAEEMVGTISQLMEEYAALSQPIRIGSVNVVRTERGWAGHFICSNRCRFRRNTLLAYKETKIVVSTVGLMESDTKIETIGHDRHFETMAFHADTSDTRYYDADVNKQVYFDSKWAIAEQDADDKANEMHESVVLEITKKLLAGELFTSIKW